MKSFFLASILLALTMSAYAAEFPVPKHHSQLDITDNLHIACTALADSRWIPDDQDGRASIIIVNVKPGGDTAATWPGSHGDLVIIINRNGEATAGN